MLAALACVGGTAMGCGDDDKRGCERLCDNIDRLCQPETVDGCIEECIVESRADRLGMLDAIHCSDEAQNCGTIQSCLTIADPGGAGGIGPGGTGGFGPGGTGGTGTVGCSNTCQTPFDNECDDGGPGSLYDLCPLGTDCSDCGPRGAGSAICNDDCATSFDMECDDGGPGALYDLCPLGTDCSDCGVRTAG